MHLSWHGCEFSQANSNWWQAPRPVDKQQVHAGDKRFRQSEWRSFQGTLHQCAVWLGCDDMSIPMHVLIMC
jgi:hypothetical protein